MRKNYKKMLCALTAVLLILGGACAYLLTGGGDKVLAANSMTIIDNSRLFKESPLRAVDGFVPITIEATKTGYENTWITASNPDDLADTDVRWHNDVHQDGKGGFKWDGGIKSGDGLRVTYHGGVTYRDEPLDVRVTLRPHAQTRNESTGLCTCGANMWSNGVIFSDLTRSHLVTTNGVPATESSSATNNASFSWANFTYGIWYFAFDSLDVTYEFFDPGTGSRITIPDMCWTFGSLSTFEGVIFMTDTYTKLTPMKQGFVNTEDVLVTAYPSYYESGGQKPGLSVAKPTLHNNDATVCNDTGCGFYNTKKIVNGTSYHYRSDEFTDAVDEGSYWKSTASMMVEGNTSGQWAFKFFDRQDSYWFAPSVGCVGATAPEPEKYILKDGDAVYDGGERASGSAVTYEIEQKVETLGYWGTGSLNYSCFKFSDTLPEEVEYVDARVEFRYQKPDGTWLIQDVTDKGRLTYSDITRNVGFAFDSDFLYTANSGNYRGVWSVAMEGADWDNHNRMWYCGESYVLVIECRATAADVSRTVTNQASTKLAASTDTKNLAGVIKNGEQTTNEVTFSQNVYTVEYRANGTTLDTDQEGERTQNTVTGSTPSQTLQRGVWENLRPNGFAREGYTFTGWNTEPEGGGTWYRETDGKGALVKDLAPANGKAVLYAQWKKNLGTETLTVKDALAGNKIPGVKLKLEKKVDGAWEAAGDVSEFTTGAGGTISLSGLHWFDYQWKVDTVPTGYKKPAAAETFSINYDNLAAENTFVLERIAYKVRYEPNGGYQPPDEETGESHYDTTTGSMDDSSFTWGVAGALRTNAFARKGYTFKEWNTKADGSGNSYKDGYTNKDAAGNVVNWTDEDGATVTLYAIWTKDLGTETIKIISEETGNPVKGVSLKLQKQVNGVWQDAYWTATGTDGTATVPGLRWFAYKWVVTGVPAGYKKAADTAFTINQDRLSAENEAILYMNHVSITIRSSVSDIVGDAPAFLYKISGTDAAGVDHSYNVLVQTDAATKKGTNTISGLFAGTYSITQTPVMRYVPGTAVNIANTVPSGINAAADVLNYTSATVQFPYTINECGWYTGVDGKVNPLTTG